MYNAVDSTDLNPDPTQRGHEEVINKPGEADFYEKYCACGIEDNNLTPETEIEYNPALQGTSLYVNTYVYKNGRSVHCPITSCILLASDCKTALSSPMSDYV